MHYFIICDLAVFQMFEQLLLTNVNTPTRSGVGGFFLNEVLRSNLCLKCDQAERLRTIVKEVHSSSYAEGDASSKAHSDKRNSEGVGRSEGSLEPLEQTITQQQENVNAAVFVKEQGPEGGSYE